MKSRQKVHSFDDDYEGRGQNIIPLDSFLFSSTSDPSFRGNEVSCRLFSQENFFAVKDKTAVLTPKCVLKKTHTRE